MKYVSIPLWFDWYLLRFIIIALDHTGLNSTMVRLIFEKKSNQVNRLTWSQFHYGSIDI